jgi:hypothetical protein
MPNPPSQRSRIAGPPRGRHAVAPPEPTVVVGPADVAKTPPPLAPGGAPSRALPPLDYDETPRPTMEATAPSRRQRPRRVLWLAMGVTLGAVGAAFVHDDARAVWRDARVWCATKLRSFESPHGVPVTSAPSVTVGVAATKVPPSPFAVSPTVAMNVPTVRAEDLPRVKPPVLFRSRPRVAAPTSPGPTDLDVEVTPLPGADDPPPTAPKTSPDTASLGDPSLGPG